METIKKKSLGPTFTDRNLEDILKHSLTRKDKEEYKRVYAKEKIEAKLVTSTVFTGSEDVENTPQ